MSKNSEIDTPYGGSCGLTYEHLASLCDLKEGCSMSSLLSTIALSNAQVDLELELLF